MIQDGLSGFFATKKDIEEVKEEIHDLRLDVLGHLDAVYKEVKDMRQEQTVHSLPGGTPLPPW